MILSWTADPSAAGPRLRACWRRWEVCIYADGQWDVTAPGGIATWMHGQAPTQKAARAIMGEVLLLCVRLHDLGAIPGNGYFADSFYRAAAPDAPTEPNTTP